MFDVLDDLEDAVGKLLASEPSGDDVERLSLLAEQVELVRLREIAAFDRSCAWAAQGFVSSASALRAKTRCSHGRALRSVRLARKLKSLRELSGSFAAGEITAEHVEVIAHAYTPKRAAMIEGIEAGLVAFARASTPAELRDVVRSKVDAFDGDGGAARDNKEQELNKVTLSSTTGGRGILNGSLDAEVTDVVLTALDAEMEALRVRGESRKSPELRAAALESICRQYLASRGDTDARGRGQTHLSVVVDVGQYAESNAELVALIRAETAHGGTLSKNTIERISCDCKISRVIMDGPSCVLDVGWTTRNVRTPSGTRWWRGMGIAKARAVSGGRGSARRTTSGIGNTVARPTSTT